MILATEQHGICAGASEQSELAPHSRILCESAGGALKLVNFNVKGELLRCGAVLGSEEPGGGKAHDAVSADGASVLFTAPDPAAKNDGEGCWNGGSENAPQLYRRSGAKTIELSAPEKGVVELTGSHPAIYVGAAEDGSRVFFLTESELTREAEADHLEDRELYEWRAEGVAGAGSPSVGVCAAPGGCLARISAGEHAGTGAQVFRVPAVSAHGTAVYFTAFEALAPGAAKLAPRPHADEEGPVNAYRYDTATAATSFLATVNTKDYPTSGCDLEALCPGASWYTTPDGAYLLFATGREQPSVGYATATPDPTQCRIPHSQGEFDGHCQELYRYHYQPGSASGGSIVCVSCDPSGAAPVSNAEFARSAPEGPASGPVRAMSDNGEYVFFDSADPLVTEAENHTLDVYEWHAGRISLISSGSEKAPSYFLGYSPYVNPRGETVEGGNVFFGTHANLVPWQSTESEGNIYDARICQAESPCLQAPPQRTGQCEDGSCHPPPPAPSDLTPTSQIFSGAGNLTGEPSPPPPPKPTAAQERAKKLTVALKLCRKKRNRHNREVCERAAKKKYGPAKAAKKGGGKR